MKNNMNRSIYHLLITLLACISLNSQAKEYEFPSGVASNINTGSFVQTNDVELPNYGSSGWLLDFYNRKIENKIVVGLHKDQLFHLSSASVIDVQLKIERDELVGVDAIPQPIEYKTIRLEYNPAQNAKEVDQVVLSYPDVVNSKVTINAVTVISGPTLTFPTPSQLPNIWLESNIYIDRIYDMDIDPIDPNLITVSFTIDQMIKIDWPDVTGAESYEIELAFMDFPASRIVGGPLSATSFDIDFGKNSTRIRVDDASSYQTPVVMPEGYLLFRVRALSQELSEEEILRASLWSLPDQATLNVTTWNGKALTKVDNFNTDINWSFNLMYAEEAKHASVLTWFDGMLRLRETIAMDNATGLPNVSQNIYDYLGRETVQASPSPFFDGQGYSFRSKVNQNKWGDQYDYTDFDLNYYDWIIGGAGLTDKLEVGKMNDVSGAGANYYYSENFNTWLQASSYTFEEKRRHSFLPDADGYAFVQSELTNDPTGRVQRSGSVGEVHKLSAYDNLSNYNQGKETRVWDATPFQAELDKLFATEVGPYTNYKKAITRDANGQLYVAYIDLFGRTVATALAGSSDSTPNLDPIASSSYSTSYDIYMKNSVNSNSEKLVNHTFFVADKDTWEFSYNFQPQKIDFECDTQFCYSCGYNLFISLVDEFGNEQIPGGAVNVFVGTIQDSLNCSKPLRFTIMPDPIKVELFQGEYTLIKKLTLSDASLVQNRDWYFKQSGCVKPYLDFLVEELDEMSISCSISCEQCDQEIADLVYERDSIKNWCETNQIDSLNWQPYLGAKTELIELVALCKKICEDAANPCAVLYDQMLRDVSPGGQYMRYFTVGEYGEYAGDLSTVDESILKDDWYNCNSTQGATTPLNWRNPESGYYKDEDGAESFIMVINNLPEVKSGSNYVTIDGKQYVKPHELKNATDFISKYWKDSWAEDLVYLHPEYCYYQKCITLEASYDYDAQLMAASSKEAKESGFYNPLDMSGLGSLTIGSTPYNLDYSSLETGTVLRDPISLHSFYTATTPSGFCYEPGASVYNCGDRFEKMLKEYSYLMPNGSGGCNSTVNTVWEVYEQSRRNNDLNFLQVEEDTCVDDVFWPILRGLYLSIKAQWLKTYFEEGCPERQDCSSGSPVALIKTPRWHGIMDNSAFTEADANWNDLLTHCDEDGFQAEIDQRIASECDQNCDENVELWLSWLGNCTAISSLSPSALTAFKADLKNLCMGGCDLDHPYGSITRSPKHLYNSSYPFANLHDVFIKHLGVNWFEAGVCDDLLIEFPGYYGHDYMAWQNPEANSCVCDSVKWHTASACPDLIYTDSTDYPCECSYPHDVTMAKTAQRYVHVAEKCQNCITCRDLIEPVNAFLERYDTMVTTGNPVLYQNLLSTWLNRHFGFNLTYYEYDAFARNCVIDTGFYQADTIWWQSWKHIGLDRVVMLDENSPIQNLDDNYSPIYYAASDEDPEFIKRHLELKVKDLGWFVSGGKKDYSVASMQQVGLENLRPLPDVLRTQRVQSPEGDNVACQCRKILEVNHLIENGQAGSLTAEQLYNQLESPSTWPTGWVFNDMRDVCCKLWNQQPPGPGSCTPAGFEPGLDFNSAQKSFIETHLNPPPGDPNVVTLSEPSCNPSVPEDTAKHYIDTCGCKAIKEIEENYLTDPDGAASGKTLQAYVLFVKGFAIDNIEDLLQACADMWGTGERKVNGQTTGQFSSTTNWSNISTDNLDEYAQDMDWLVNESLLCNPPDDPCQNNIRCSDLTHEFLRLIDTLYDIHVASGPFNLPDFAMYEDIHSQLGLMWDWIDYIRQDDVFGDPVYDAKTWFMQNLADSLNLIFNKCEPGDPYSIEYFLHVIRTCNTSGGKDVEPCTKPLSCAEIGQTLKEFLADNPIPSNPGYAPSNWEQFANDIGRYYFDLQKYDGVIDQDYIDAMDWFDLMQTFFNEKHNKCYDGPNNYIELGNFLKFTSACGPNAVQRQKADPCPKCYVGDTTYLNAFKDFLNDVTAKDEPWYLHQSLWDLKVPPGGNLTYDFPSFYNNTILYDNGYSSDLIYTLNKVKVPELDVVISDDNGYTLEFNLLFPSTEKKWNFGEIMEFLEINPVRSGGCNPPNLFDAVVVYRIPDKYWGDKPNCPNVTDPQTFETFCYDTLTLMGQFKNKHIGQEVPCLGCSRLCNKPFVRPIVPKEHCRDEDIHLAIENAFIRYGAYLTKETERFDSLYRNLCMNPDSLDEKTRIKYEDKTYHYTLYYYDRAGSLVKTVPPAGIDFESPDLSQVDRNLLIQDRIIKTDDYRQSPSTNPRTYTYHSLVTQYKYNSLGVVVSNETPDGGLTESWYDALARPVLSQNARQFDGANAGKYSYMIYDELGRISESGQIDRSNLSSGTVTPSYTALPANITSFLTTISGNHDIKTEVRTSQYDNPGAGSRVTLAFADLGGQQNLRNVVACMTYEEVYDNDETTYSHASYFSYDALGNVDRLIQDIPALDPLERNLFSLNYTYDLLSGNVHKVAYQQGKADQFFHKYEYDENNRLKQVYTSGDNYSWERDARYDYYLHGTLARMELGELNVQGVDYAYSLHGWLKSVNSPVINPSLDIGMDGYQNIGSSNAHQYVARDVFAFDLHYFTGDYKPIHNGSYGPATLGSDLAAYTSDLYNGNIARMTTTIPDSTKYVADSIAGDVMGNVYRYDQLNRITKHRVYQNYNSSSYSWGNTVPVYAGDDVYYEDFSYDASGNITALNRHGHISSKLEMDQFTYHYEEEGRAATVIDGVGTKNISWNVLKANKLYHVNDASPYAPDYANDIDDPGTGFTTSGINLNNTYGYDELGNLIRDNESNISTIEWTNSGKIKAIVRVVGSPEPDLEFGYDNMDNRLYKIVKPKDATMGNALTTEVDWVKEYYVRDATGNLIATYAQRYGENMGNYQDTLELNQVVVYGSSRLGVINHSESLVSREFTASINGDNRFENKDYSGSTVNVILTYQSAEFKLVRGLKQYELSNHLGNVLVTIQDRRQSVDSTVNGVTDYYIPYIVTAQDYYAFGSLMDERGFELGAYLYGFQGQEKDDEVSGNNGDYVTFKYRIHDARLGRFLSVDPLAPEYPWNSTYAFAENRVIDGVELEGLEYRNATGKEVSEFKKNGNGNLNEGDVGFVYQIGEERYATWVGEDQYLDEWGHISNESSHMVGDRRVEREKITFDRGGFVYKSWERFENVEGGVTYLQVKQVTHFVGLNYNGTSQVVDQTGRVPDYMKTAWGEYGKNEANDASFIVNSYHQIHREYKPSTAIGWSGAWCSSFASWCLIQSGHTAQRDAGAWSNGHPKEWVRSTGKFNNRNLGVQRS